jgi:acetyl esterase
VALVVTLSSRLAWPELERVGVRGARKEAEREAWVLTGRRVRGVSVEPLAVTSRAGSLEARLYRPHGGSPAGPLLVYLHGGGWVFGSPSTHDGLCRLIARHGRLAVLSCAYRLAPEHPFPAPVEDAVEALAWARREAATLGVDRARIAIGGDSAGGNLAAVAAALSEEPVWRQLLLYPVLDLSREHDSYRSADGPVLSAAQMRWFRSEYLAQPEDAADPRVSPLLAEDLSRVRRTYLAIPHFDPLRDEGCAYAERLRRADVDVTVSFSAAQPHAFAEFAGVCRSARAELLTACHWLRAASVSRPAPRLRPASPRGWWPPPLRLGR